MVNHKTKHGHNVGGKPSRTYTLWSAMRERCKARNSAHQCYKDISVCDDWKDFNNFLRDMGVAPEGLTLDRIDNKKGYSKDNCRWATRSLQNHNRRKRGNGSKYIGVHKVGNKFCAQIYKDTKDIYLGLWETEELAAEAYDKAAFEMYGHTPNREALKQICELSGNSGTLGVEDV